MAQQHKSKYKTPKDFEKSQKPKLRKDLKDYTHDDKKGGSNPKSTGDIQLNVLRKRDKAMQDNGKLYPTYNDDDRLYKDIEDGNYDPKTAAKRLKKRQDAEEKETADILKDKLENLTREQRERVVREYVRKKIVKIIREQATTPEKETPAEPTTPDPASTTPDPTAAPTTPDPATTTPTTPDPTAAPTTPDPATTTPTTTSPTAAPTTTEPSSATDNASAEKQISPETKEALDLDRFVKYLDKQDGNIAKVKILLKAINLATKDLDPADLVNTYKMLKIATNKRLAKFSRENSSTK